MTEPGNFTVRQSISPSPQQPGFTLVELMVAMVIGMIIILTATSLVLSVKSAHSAQNDISSIEDTATYVLNNITRSVKQAGYFNFDRSEAPDVAGLTSDNISSGISGLDASTLKANSYGMDGPAKSANHYSDVLAIRYVGSGVGSADNSVLNCAGFGVAADGAGTDKSAEAVRGWSIYYVANDADGEPNLYCKYRNSQFTAQSIGSGIESFQVLYGIDTSNPANGIVNQFLNATEINALDAGIPSSELNHNTNWKKVTAVKIAILMRGTQNMDLSPQETYHLFGEQYSKLKSSTDQGTKISASDIPADQRQRYRKIFGTTIQLRNSLR